VRQGQVLASSPTLTLGIWPQSPGEWALYGIRWVHQRTREQPESLVVVAIALLATCAVFLTRRRVSTPSLRGGGSHPGEG